jgi:PTS system beta-glucosides-specific IIC component
MGNTKGGLIITVVCETGCLIMNSKVLAEDILQRVGGESNVATLVHCATRLRFKIVDNSKVNLAELEMLDGVIAVVNGSGQLQVVIGNRVPEVFRAFGEISSLLDDGKNNRFSMRRKIKSHYWGG